MVTPIPRTVYHGISVSMATMKTARNVRKILSVYKAGPNAVRLTVADRHPQFQGLLMKLAVSPLAKAGS